MNSMVCGAAASAGDAKLRAVIIGAGLAGLSTAQALCPLFDEVAIVERDPVDAAGPFGIAGEHPDQGQLTGRSRPGVVQFAHPHVLLRRGLNILNELFDCDFEATLEDAGATKINWISDATVSAFGGENIYEHIPGPSGTEQARGVCGSRSLYEGVVRKEVLARNAGKISFVSGAVAKGLRFASGAKAVTGLELADGSVLPADLVVDASGRKSGVADWLAAAGCEAPPTKVVSSGVGYGSRVYKLKSGMQDEGRCDVTFGELPHDHRGGILMQVEGGCYQTILWGYLNDHPAGTEEGYLAFAKSLASPSIYDRLQKMEPVSRILRFNRTENFRRYYDKVKMPEGLAVLGDAAAAFNPVHGQGITVGLMGAVALRDLVAERMTPAIGGTLAARRAALVDLPQEFQAKHAVLAELPWQMATAEDNRQTGSVPDAGPVQGLVNNYLEYLRKVSQADPQAQLKMWKVYHAVVGDPAIVFSPSLLLAALKYWLRFRLAAAQRLVAAAGRGGAESPPQAADSCPRLLSKSRGK